MWTPPLNRSLSMSAVAAAPGYSLAAPTEQDALDSLARLLGPDQASDTWTAARAAAGCRLGPLTPDAYATVLDQLKAQGGMASIVGNSLSVRLRAYRSLIKD